MAAVLGQGAGGGLCRPAEAAGGTGGGIEQRLGDEAARCQCPADPLTREGFDIAGGITDAEDAARRTGEERRLTGQGGRGPEAGGHDGVGEWRRGGAAIERPRENRQHGLGRACMLAQRPPVDGGRQIDAAVLQSDEAAVALAGDGHDQLPVGEVERRRLQGGAQANPAVLRGFRRRCLFGG